MPSLALVQPRIPSRKRFKQIGLCEGAKILDLDAKRSAPVDGLASRPGVPSPPPPSSPQIGQGGLNVTSQEVRKGFEKKLFKKLRNDLV